MGLGVGHAKLISLAALLSLAAPLSANATTTATSNSTHHHTTHHHYAHATSAVHTVSAEHHHYSHHAYVTRSAAYGGSYSYGHHHYRAYRVAYRGIQCVTFARADSGIVLSGNAADWWNHAAGVYQRGARPEVGAVLNFRANPRMRLGHVAVVSNVVDARTVEIDQANWGGGSGRHGGYVSRSTMVVDVSPNNDWTAVRVGLDHAGDYGSIYPTYGFIYARPDDGVVVASNTSAAAPADTKNAAPSDLRRGPSYDEVAETPQVSGVDTSGIDTGSSLGLDAPDRSIQ